MTESIGFKRAQAPDRTHITVRLWKGERSSVFEEIIPPQESDQIQMAVPVTGPRSPVEALAVAAVLASGLVPPLAFRSRARAAKTACLLVTHQDPTCNE